MGRHIPQKRRAPKTDVRDILLKLLKKLKDAPIKSIIPIAYSNLRRYEHKIQAKVMACLLLRYYSEMWMNYEGVIDALYATLKTFKFRSVFISEMDQMYPKWLMDHSPLQRVFTIVGEKILHILHHSECISLDVSEIKFTHRQSYALQFRALVYIDHIINQQRTAQGKDILKHLVSKYYLGGDVERIIIKFWIPEMLIDKRASEISALEIVETWVKCLSTHEPVDIVEIMVKLMRGRSWSEFSTYYIPHYIFFERIAIHSMIDPPNKYTWIKQADDLFSIKYGSI